MWIEQSTRLVSNETGAFYVMRALRGIVLTNFNADRQSLTAINKGRLYNNIWSMPSGLRYSIPSDIGKIKRSAKAMQDEILLLIEKFGYFGVSLLIFIENLFPPIPSEGILLFGGYAARTTSLNIIGVIISATVGSMLGAIALYSVGRAFGKERLKGILAGKIGRILHFRPESIDKADVWFSRFSSRAVLVCRCIPIVRSVISIPAGISKMKPVKFLLLTLLGSTVWNSLIVWLGYKAGAAWKSVEKWLGVYSDIVLIIIIAAAVVCVAVVYLKKRTKRAAQTERRTK